MTHRVEGAACRRPTRTAHRVTDRPDVPPDPQAYDTERNAAARRRGPRRPVHRRRPRPGPRPGRREERRYLRMLADHGRA